MTDTSHVLASIDHALDDYETSVDAMRWTPEAVETVERWPVRYPGVVVIPVDLLGE